MTIEMKQRTLLDYCTSRRRSDVPRSKTTFLHLPYNLRRLIYRYSGLFDGTIVYWNYYVSKGVCQVVHGGNGLGEAPPDAPKELSIYCQAVSQFLDGRFPPANATLNRRCPCVNTFTACREEHKICHCETLPSQLLYVSPLIAREVASIFYTTNRFSMCLSDVSALALSGLQSLGHRALGWLTYLTISLNVCKCLPATPLCQVHSNDCHPPSKRRGHDEPLRKGVSRAEKSEWKRLCNLLAAHIAPNRLKLSVICDVADDKTAMEITDPILRLPVLRECAIRLGKEPFHHLLGPLATATALQASGRRIDLGPKPFRFMDLPKEIQVQILEHTDLTTPYDITWAYTREGNTYFQFHLASISLDPSRDYSPDCCSRCADDLEACCCWTCHSAYSTTCTCWKMPRSFFSVNRRFRKLAIDLFYSRNHFVLLPAKPSTDAPSMLSRFVDQVPLEARGYLRSITWILSSARKQLLMRRLGKPGRAMQPEWLDIVDIIARDMDLSQLSFTVDMSIDRYWFNRDPIHSDVLPPGLGTLEERVTASRLVKTMARYKGWKNFYLHMSVPGIDYTREHIVKHKLMEELFERHVMGEDYDSLASGKRDRRHLWNGYARCLEECQECDDTL